MAAERSTLEVDPHRIWSVWFDSARHIEVSQGSPRVLQLVPYTETDGTPWIAVYREGKGITQRIVASKLERVCYG
jgi:hypothetical protein